MRAPTCEPAGTGRDTEPMWIEVTTIGDLLDRQAARTPDADALVLPGVRMTYSELSAASDAVARSLLGLGVAAGDHVGILMPNRLEFVLALFAIAKLGAVTVPINARFKTHELGQVIGHADLRLLFTSASPGADYPAMLAQLPDLPPVIDVDHGFGPEASGEELAARRQRVRVRDVAMLMYTSGTSARPKGCLLTHEALVRQGATVAATRFDLTAADSFWDPLPLFHIGGIVPMLGCFSAGAKFCHAGHFDPAVALRTLERERCTVIYPAFETIWLAVLDHPEFERTDLSAIRLIQSIAVPERLRQLEARMPWAAQVSSYGATESSSNLTLTRADDPFDVRMETLGFPLPGLEVKIVDPETGERVPPGVAGELCYRGYSLFDGYYKEPELTAAAFDDEGFFHSQDLARLDDEGRVIYAGRLKDMLKVGGENVSALEVEGYLVTHPAVNIAQVVAAPDGRYDEVPAAFVQLKPGVSLDEQELIDYCLGRIATYKVPRYVRVVTEWPMSGTKIQKFVLREQIARELADAGLTEAPKLTPSR
jgi:fatty-acyl-CoA synthase